MTLDIEGLTEYEWLALRKDYLGASEASTVLRLSTYSTPYKLWLEKMSSEIDVKRAARLRWGVKLEPLIVDDWCEMRGIDPKRFYKPTVMFIDDEYPFLSANDDRIFIDDDGEPTIYEVKSVGGMAENYWDSDVPLSYYHQGQQQMRVTVIDGKPVHRMRFLVYNKETCETRQVPETGYYDFSPEYFNKTIPAMAKFWNDYVIPRVPPPYDVEDVSAIVPVGGTVVEANKRVLTLFDEYRLKNAVKLATEKEVKALVSEIGLFMGENEGLTKDGKLIATYPVIKRKGYTVKDTQYRQFKPKGE